MRLPSPALPVQEPSRRRRPPGPSRTPFPSFPPRNPSRLLRVPAFSTAESQSGLVTRRWAGPPRLAASLAASRLRSRSVRSAHITSSRRARGFALAARLTPRKGPVRPGTKEGTPSPGPIAGVRPFCARPPPCDPATLGASPAPGSRPPSPGPSADAPRG